MVTQHDSPPIPDPTVLTTAALLREIANLAELLQAQIGGLDEKVSTRLDGMDKAIELLQKLTDRIPSDIALAVSHLQQLHEEKFAGINTQFAERDTRTAETANLNKLAIDAALQAQKEAAGKSEEGFTKLIEKLDDLITTKTGALGTEIRANMATLDTKSNNNKERLDRFEGQGAGVAGSWAVVAAVIGIGFAAIGAVGVILALQ